ncbi:SMP-30/gluconolactonase/LRE family protein [Phenylobacterium deserti]|uniref:SMP-30/gluconolactonase/LRE family protein n=1 Tax=Phenylobacterium deserti TaxID=1914756 RepID=A0A328AEW6_9CAUL|nr:SMP-30/gluconolactonase/LRE family protein [Phenylobacterium deserti]RAK51328.1 SMP-30/gluconolactonase/LRE family protein [Phenylobacterium deserti]
MSQTSAPECVHPVAAELGEGPVWRAGEGALWFVDIKGRKIHRFLPDTGEAQSWDAPASPGFIAPLASGQWIAGLKTGLHWFDPAAGVFELLQVVEDPRLDNRLNDGFVDARGRLWFGSMHDPEETLTGALYRFDRDGLARMDDGYCITNGPATSPDGRTLYHTDTLGKVIYAFDVSEDGAVSNKREFARIEEGAGYPDGPAVDAEGCVWTGLFAGWGARRYSPAGELLDFVRFPVANVTKLAFGGPDLTTVYATTAWKGLSDEARVAQPLAGGLFRFNVSTPGLPQNEVRDV